MLTSFGLTPSKALIRLLNLSPDNLVEVMKHIQWHRVAQFFRRYPRIMRVLYYVYRHFQPKYSVGVIGVVMNPANEVLLVEHVFHPYHPIGLPGGWINANEDPALAVKRELKEELDLDVEVTDVILTQRTQTNHLDVAFLCQPLSPIGNLSFELLGYKWYTLDQLPKLHSFHYDAIRRSHNIQQTRR